MSNMPNPKQQTFGWAGGSLDGEMNPFGQQGRTGHRGETLTAEVLRRAFGSDPEVYVFHDVSIPSKQLTVSDNRGANIDHVVVRGRRVLLIDSKVWGHGFYYGGFWGIAPHRRQKNGKSGLFPPAGKRTVGLSVDRFTKLLAPWKPTVVGMLMIHPQGGKSSYWALRLPDGVKKVVVDASTGSRLRGMLRGSMPTDPAMLNAIQGFVRR